MLDTRSTTVQLFCSNIRQCYEPNYRSITNLAHTKRHFTVFVNKSIIFYHILMPSGTCGVLVSFVGDAIECWIISSTGDGDDDKRTTAPFSNLKGPIVDCGHIMQIWATYEAWHVGPEDVRCHFGCWPVLERQLHVPTLGTRPRLHGVCHTRGDWSIPT